VSRGWRDAAPANGSNEGASGWELPRGPHGLPREVVVDHQRQRLLAGAARAVADRGYAATTVEHVLVNAGVSRTTFYENFDNKRGCILAAHEQAFSRLAGELAGACARKPSWPAKVSAAIAAAIEFATRAPDEALLLVLEAVAPDSVLASRVLASNAFLVAMLRGGREQWPAAASLPDLTERVLVGAATAVIGTRLMAGQADRLAVLEPQLVQLVLMPYLGNEAARRVAESSQ
jgi:AcrR family transcriptional regulator